MRHRILIVTMLVVIVAVLPARADVPRPLMVAVPSAVDLSAWLPPVVDSGLYAPVCTAVAVAYYYRTLQARMVGDDVTFSPTDIYGALGMCSLQVPDAMLALWQQQAQSWRIAGYTRLLLDVDALRAHLAGGDAFVAVFPMYGNWQALFWWHERIIGLPWDTRRCQGWHTVTVVGYDDEKQAFKVVNCWGPTWGMNGLGWVSFDFVRLYTREAWLMVDAPDEMPQSSHD